MILKVDTTVNLFTLAHLLQEVYLDGKIGLQISFIATLKGRSVSPRVFRDKNVVGTIYFNDHADVPHVHVRVGGHEGKFFFEGTVSLWENVNLTESEIRKAIDTIRSHKGHCWKIWHDIYGK